MNSATPHLCRTGDKVLMVTIHTFLDTGKRAIWNNNNTRNINNNKFKGTAKNALLLLSI